jgi:hypothetical protein
MNRTAIILIVFMIAGCLASDPAAREARRLKEQSFKDAVSGLELLDKDGRAKYGCKSLGQVLGKGGLLPRSYEADLKHATLKAKQAAVKAGGNAVILISSQLSLKFPREAVVIAEALDCDKIEASPYKKDPAPTSANPANGQAQ